MQTVTQGASMADSTATTNNLQITKDRVKSWAACSDGYRWFLGNFPEGAEFAPVYRALIADKRGDDADWLVGKFFDGLDTTTRVKQTAIIAGADAAAIAAQVAAGAEAATTGDWANAATTGEGRTPPPRAKGRTPPPRASTLWPPLWVSMQRQRQARAVRLC